MTVSFTVPGIPPSVNHYVKHARGRHYQSTEAVRFKQSIGILADGQQLPPKSRYYVWIAVYLGPKQRGDIDNFPKLVLDGLVAARVIDTDAAIDHLDVTKERCNFMENARTAITVGVIE